MNQTEKLVEALEKIATECTNNEVSISFIEHEAKQALESYKENNNSDFVSKTKLLEWVEDLLANERNLDAYDLLDKLKELTDK